jgi:hypothetical protein
LKDEIIELKQKLSDDQPALGMIMSEGDVNKHNDLFANSEDKIEDFLVSLSDHFFEETTLVKRVDELCNKYYLNKLSTVNIKILLEQTKLRFGEDSDKARLIEKELEIVLK